MSSMKPGTRLHHKQRIRKAITPLLEGKPENLEHIVESAAFSRFHFQRVFKEIMGETPGELRRRLLLERAAYRLTESRTAITEIAFDAEYDSLEGFTRAFKRAYGMSPSVYRRSAPAEYKLGPFASAHYSPLVPRVSSGVTNMDLIDRLIEHDYWLTRQILERARKLRDKQLDAPLPTPSHPVGFESKQKTLRELLDRLVLGREVWVAATEGGCDIDLTNCDPKPTSIEKMIARFELAYPIFMSLVKRCREQNAWNQTFVDDLCEPPETFTFGGMIAHVFTFGITRRQLALEILRNMGVEDLSYGDPITWERSLEPQSSSAT